MRLLESGQYELCKRNVHGLLGATVALCLAYNVAAIIQRPKPSRHLYWNALLYLGVLTVEITHFKHHEASR